MKDMSKKQTGLLLLSILLTTITLALLLTKVIPELSKPIEEESTYVYEGDTYINQTTVNQTTIINVTVNTYEVRLKFKGWQDIPNPCGAGYLLRQKCLVKNYWGFKVYNVTITVEWPNGTVSDLVLKLLPTSIYSLDIDEGTAYSGYIDNPNDELITEVRTYGYSED